MSNIQNFKKKVSTSISLKLAVIALLLLLLQIPLLLVKDLIFERQQMQQKAQQEVSQGWGGEQYLGSPLVTVRFKKSKMVKDKKLLYVYENQIMASSFKADIDLQASKRYLAIYEIPVFVAKVKLTGEVVIDPTLHLGQQQSWALDSFFIPIKQMRGLRSIDKLLINGKPMSLSQQQNTVQGMTGLSVNLKSLDQQEKIHYEVELVLAGSEKFNLLPMAGQSNVQMSSNWPSPSFSGDFLPESRVITKEGFQASWKVNELNHNLGRVLKHGVNYNLTHDRPEFGVKVLIPANIYQVNERTAKYGLLIMLLTFAGFFLAEMFFKLRLHPFQYILIGFSLSVFYLLLLSLSEYIRYSWAFLLAASSIIVLIGTYCSVVLGQRKRGIYTAILFSLLYAFIYVLVKAEQLSLLMGAIGIWLFLAVVMYLTRKIDWYSISEEQ